jgi:hypothetical protein
MGAFLLVEGEDDKKLLRRFVNEPDCKIVVAHGKPNVLEALQILQRTGVQGICGVVDLDYSAILGSVVEGSDIVTTDTHDLETMLLASSACDDVLTEFGAGEDAIAAFRLRFGCGIREWLLRTAEPIGLLRLFSERDSLSLDFDGLALEDFVSEHTLALNLDHLIDIVITRSRCVVLGEEMRRRVSDLKSGSPLDPWQVCQGHDLVDLMSIALRRVLARNHPSHVKRERLETALRLAYGRESFESTNLYASLVQWEAENPRFRVFAGQGGGSQE